MGIRIKVDGVEQPTNSDFSNTMSKEDKDLLWQVLAENGELKQQITELEATLGRIKAIVGKK